MKECDDIEPEPFSLASLLRRPEQQATPSPCQTGCLAGGDTRRWIGLIAQAEKLGLGREEALEQAWRVLVEVNPFPATTGRICPHPCEDDCTRQAKDGGVAVNAIERFLGDWALERGLRLHRIEEQSQPESIGVVGAGPAGLSFAYQMARRGYPVTVYEREQQPGGMLLRGIPAYRLPDAVLQAEIDRLVELGVELRLGSRVGMDVPLSRLRERHDAVFLGIGAQVGRSLEIPGADGPGCTTGIEYLRRFNQGLPCGLGEHVVVVGGGNTAIDAARAARRSGCRVTIVYRRSRPEMPAIAAEVEHALAEGVAFLEQVVPVEVLREADAVRGLRLLRMRLGAPDSSGRRRPEPIPGSEFQLAADAVIAAVSQEPDWEGLEAIRPPAGWIPADARGVAGDGVWAGGDAVGPGVAALAIAQGRLCAEAVHARLRGTPPPALPEPRPTATPRVKLDFCETRPRAEPAQLPPAERLAAPGAEVFATLDQESALREASRCLSCGSCFGCEHCSMYCNPAGFTRLDEVAPGAYFALDLGRCEGCGKCIDVCPCGFLRVR